MRFGFKKHGGYEQACDALEKMIAPGGRLRYLQSGSSGEFPIGIIVHNHLCDPNEAFAFRSARGGLHTGTGPTIKAALLAGITAKIESEKQSVVKSDFYGSDKMRQHWDRPVADLVADQLKVGSLSIHESDLQGALK